MCVGQASMTPEERAAALAKMPAADRAAALVRGMGMGMDGGGGGWCGRMEGGVVATTWVVW